MKERAPAFQFYAADYLADENVVLMTLDEEGAYIRALAHCWREGSIPADPKLLSRMLKGASNETVATVQRCFVVDGDRLVHLRLEKERKKQREWSKKSREAGIASGKARREKKFQGEPKKNGGSPMVEPKPNSSSSSPSSSASKEIYTATPSASPNNTATRGTRIPEHFTVTAAHREFARLNGLPNPEEHVEGFVDYWSAQPGSKAIKLDWDATFRNWLRRTRPTVRSTPITFAQQREQNIRANGERALEIMGIRA